MKTPLLLLLSISIYSQIGIGTTTPTETLDINGTLRVRNLTTGTTETTSTGIAITAPYTFVCAGIIKDNGDPIKMVNCTVRRINTLTVKITFNTPQSDNNYLILATGEMRLLYYRDKRVNSFELMLAENYDNSVHNFIVYKI